MTYKKIIFERLVLGALLGWLAVPLAAQAPRWTALGPDGGTVLALTPDPRQTGVVYATAGEAGVFKTTDQGATWRNVLTRNALGNVAVDPVQSSVLYAVAFPGVVWKSVDAGARWAPIGEGLPAGPGLIQSVAVDPALRTRVYLGSNQWVYRSLNAGASWQVANQGLPATAITALVAVQKPAGTVFAGTALGLYRSTNGGGSWQRLTRGLPALAVARLASAPSDPRTLYALIKDRGLYRTTDGGANWQPVAGPPAGTNQIRSLAVDARSTTTLYAAIQGGSILRTTDVRRWREIGSLPGEFPSALTPDPRTPGRLYAGLNHAGIVAGGVFRSDDSGAHWTRRSTGYTALATISLDVDPTDAQRIWTSASSVLFYSENGGARWFRAALPEGAGPAGTLALAPPSTAIFQNGLGSLGSSIWRTANDGASWTRVVSAPSSPIPSQVFLYAGAPSAPGTAYAVVANRSSFPPAIHLQGSTDGGASWQGLSGSIPLACGVGDLAIASSNPSILYLVGQAADPVRFCNSPAPAGVLRSENGGGSFSSVDAGLPPGSIARAAVDPADPDTVYVAYERRDAEPENGIWKTTDGGATWSPTGAGIGNSVVDLIVTAAPARIYAALDDGRILRSEDGGVSWNDVTAGLLSRRVFELKADPINPNRVYAATTNGIWVLE